MNKPYLFYVYGAGLGHLNRVLNFIFTENIALQQCIILTNSNFCNYIPKAVSVVQKTASFFKSKKEFNLFLKKTINFYDVSHIIVDVFPVGFYGEFEEGFQSFGSIKTILLSRILKDSYFSNYKTPTYDIIFLMEQGINTEHLKSNSIHEFDLKNRPNKINQGDYPSIKTPFFLIIHSSPASEVLLLYKQAILFRTNQHIYIQTHSKLHFNINQHTTVL